MAHRSSASDRTDVYTRITVEIVAAIEAGAGAWRMPWHHDGAAASRPINVASNRPYRGVNTLALWTAALAAGYGHGLWGTYRQWQAAGAQVMKGKRATTIVLWKEVRGVGDDADDGADRRRKMFARAFSVFNIAQVEGYELKPAPILPDEQRLAHAESFIANLAIPTMFGASSAYYRPADDTVCMPDFAAFENAASFYGAWLHENGHATGAKNRLDRDLSGRFGSAAYAFEEISVELMSGMVLADLGVAHHPRPCHAAYIKFWLEVLKGDPRAIFTASSKAQQAADWMHAQQPHSQAAAEGELLNASRCSTDGAGQSTLRARGRVQPEGVLSRRA